MTIPTILTALAWFIVVTIPIVGAHKSHKKLQNTRKKIKKKLTAPTKIGGTAPYWHNAPHTWRL